MPESESKQWHTHSHTQDFLLILWKNIYWLLLLNTLLGGLLFFEIGTLWYDEVVQTIRFMNGCDPAAPKMRMFVSIYKTVNNIQIPQKNWMYILLSIDFIEQHFYSDKWHRCCRYFGGGSCCHYYYYTILQRNYGILCQFLLLLAFFWTVPPPVDW